MPARVPPQVSLEREARAWELYTRKGWTQAEIAAELEVTQPAVSQILARVAGRVHRSLERRVKQEKARQTAVLDGIVSEGLKAWEASKQATTKTSRRTKTATGAAGSDASMSSAAAAAVPFEIQELQASENRHGDPRYLDQVREALADIRKIWGVNAPKVVHVDPPPANPFERLSDDELQQELTRLQQQQQYLESRQSLRPPAETQSAGDEVV